MANILWSGTVDAYERLESAKANPISQAQYEAQVAAYNEDFPEGAPAYQVFNGTAIISVKGTLENKASLMDKLFFDVCDYQGIAEQAVAALNDSNISRIVLDVDSPGGNVNGIEDLREVLAKVDAQKPVYTYASGGMMSAAYWIGSAGREIAAAKTAEIGSIGVVVIHQDYTRSLENQGIKATVIRSGLHKALGNPYEVLTDLAEQDIQAKVTALNNIFVSDIAQSRGKSSEYVDQVMGQGRTFLGQQAKEVGLIDDVSSFEDFLQKISSGTHNPVNTGANMSTPQKRVLVTATQQALAASGAPIDATPVAATESPVQGTTQAIEPTSTPVTEPEAQALTTQVAASEPTASNDLTTLQARVGTLEAINKELVTNASHQAVKAMSAEAALLAQKEVSQKLNTQVEALAAIGLKAVNNMRIALSMPSLSALSPDDVITAHASMSADFTKKFVVGGVATSSASASVQGSQNVQDEDLFRGSANSTSLKRN